MFWRRMHVYTVHINPKLANPYEEAKFVEEGFNLTAFLLAPLWALYYRLWWAFFIIVVANLTIMQMADSGTLSHIGKAVLHLGVHLIVGFEGNDWRRSRLARSGHIMTDIVTGDSRTRAQQRFYDHYFTQSTPA